MPPPNQLIKKTLIQLSATVFILFAPRLGPIYYYFRLVVFFTLKNTTISK